MLLGEFHWRIKDNPVDAFSTRWARERTLIVVKRLLRRNQLSCVKLHAACVGGHCRPNIGEKRVVVAFDSEDRKCGHFTTLYRFVNKLDFHAHAVFAELVFAGAMELDAIQIIAFAVKEHFISTTEFQLRYWRG